MTAQCYSQGINQQKRVELRHADWLSRYLYLKNMQDVNGRKWTPQEKYVKDPNFPTKFRLFW